MAAKRITTIMQNRFVRIALAMVFILAVPLVAMQFSDEVNWTLGDFVVMGALIFGTGLAYELVSRKVSKKHRLVVGVVLTVVFLLAWAELAVGLFGSPFAGS